MKFKDHFAGTGKPILQLVTFCNRLYVDEYCAIFLCTALHSKMHSCSTGNAHLISYFLNGKSMRKYRANVPKNTQMAGDPSPGGAALLVHWQ